MISRAFLLVLPIALTAVAVVCGVAQAQQYRWVDQNGKTQFGDIPPPPGALSKRGVPFKEVQVFDPDTNDELKRVSGGLDVPTLLVNRSVQRGFEQSAFDALLDSAGYPKAGILPALTPKASSAPEGYVSAAERDAANPVTQPAAVAQPKAGRYDSSGLTDPAPKPGQYDPSTLTGPPPKTGQYGIPAEHK